MKVAATTTVVADIVREIGGRQVYVLPLIPHGTDPHRYTLSDAQKQWLKDNDIIFSVGLGLEELAQDDLLQIAIEGTPLRPVTANIPRDRLLPDRHSPTGINPHVWMDPLLWHGVIEVIEEELIHIDPRNEEIYAENAKRARHKLVELHHWIEEQFARLPGDLPLIITNHASLDYLARGYGLTTDSIQPSTTTDKVGLKLSRFGLLLEDEGNVVLLDEYGMPFNDIRQLALDTGFEIDGVLYTDSLDSLRLKKEVDGIELNVGTYIGAMKFNILKICDAIRRSSPQAQQPPEATGPSHMPEAEAGAHAAEVHAADSGNHARDTDAPYVKDKSGIHNIDTEEGIQYSQPRDH